MEKSGFQCEKFDLENFRSESFSIRTSKGSSPASELVLLRGGLPFENSRSHYSGEALCPKLCIEG